MISFTFCYSHFGLKNCRDQYFYGNLKQTPNESTILLTSNRVTPIFFRKIVKLSWIMDHDGDWMIDSELP